MGQRGRGEGEETETKVINRIYPERIKKYLHVREVGRISSKTIKLARTDGEIRGASYRRWGRGRGQSGGSREERVAREETEKGGAR